MKIKPYGDKILIKRIEPEEVKKGSIIIPDTVKEKPQQGKVIAVGTGKLDEKGKRHKADVKVGDRILFSKYAGTEVEIDDEEYLMMGEDDILATVE